MKEKRWRNKKYLALVASRVCIVCRADDGTVVAHHIKDKTHTGAGVKAPDNLVFPLCHKHHLGEQGIHSRGRLWWEKKYGSQWQFVMWTLAEKIEEECGPSGTTTALMDGLEDKNVAEKLARWMVKELY